MNCIYSLLYFCSDSNDILSKFSCLVCTTFQYLYDTVNCILTPIKNFLTFASEYLVKFCNLSSFKLGKSILSTYTDTDLLHKHL